LPTNGSFTLTAVYGSTHYGANGLPDISSQITIEGNGSTIERDSGAPSFRILAVAQLGELTLNEATISGADKSGMQNLGILTVNNTVISDNTGDTGGGIENFSDLTINNSTISSNTGGLGGGVSHFQGFGCFDEFTETIINNSTISGNAGWFGGGVVEFNFGCYDGAFNMTINNSTISGNSASYAGGGVFHYSAYSDDVLTISNSTITGNSASSRGGGVFSRWAETIINRSIISGNVAPEDREIHGIIDSTYNLLGYSGDSGVSFPLSPSDIVPAEALSDILDTALLHNGGSTATHALVPGSPAIDASPADADCLVTDQRGLARPQGAACDIGAFEFVSAGTLYDDVQELVDDKTLAPQQGRPLIWLLRQTHRLIQREQFGKAIMNLNNFINTINRFIDMGALTPAEGQPLIDSTQALIDSLTP
ncbi:MAG: hypothetical protein GY943_18055, partial [Chloroflexi bacterium]|nr:hypothetical protein [Chloroflexota bacterium]